MTRSVYRAPPAPGSTQAPPVTSAPPSTAPPPEWPRPRVQTLSDLVFGLALSLGALELISQPPAEPGELYYGLVMFAFSFVILVTVWYSHATVMASLPMETRGLLALDLVLLFAVAIEPYLLYVVAFHGGGGVGEPASVLYAVDLAGMNAILAAFYHVLAREERPLVPPALQRKMRLIRDFTLGLAVFFLVTALPIFWSWTVLWGIPSRVVLWTLTLPVGWVRRIVTR